MPDEEPVVWPDDPVEGDSATGDPEAARSEPSDWPASFDEALKQSQAIQEPGAAAPQRAAAAAPAPAVAANNEYPTQPSMPAIAAKTVPPEPSAAPEVAKTSPPEPAKTEEAVAALGVPDEAPTSTFKTPLPAPADVSASNGGDLAAKTAPPAAEAEAQAEPEPAEAPAAVAAETEPEPVSQPEPETAPEPEPAVAEAAGTEPAKTPEPEPAPEPVAAAAPPPRPEPEPEPVNTAEPAPAPATAPEPAPEPKKEDEWIPLPANPPMPSWAPRVGQQPEQPHPVHLKGEAAATSVPAWAPTTSSMQAASRQATGSTAPAQGSQPPQAAAPAPIAGGSRPPEPAKGKTSSWEIVQPKQSEQQRQAYAGPSPEDKSYSEWFAWAKRSGAPASACHSAAQGAFRALAAGHDMNTAVNWATQAMASPPGLVSASRQLYCAWYSLGNIDLRLPSPQAHAFAAGAIAALEGGADAPTAHQAGLAAAGITA